MRCDQALEAISAAVDGELIDDDGTVRRGLDEHLTGCDGCRDFQSYTVELRARLRFEAVVAAPDIAPAVVAVLERDAAERDAEADPPRSRGPGREAGATVTSLPFWRRARSVLRPAGRAGTGPASPSAPGRASDPPGRPLAAAVAAAVVAGMIVGAAFVGVGHDTTPTAWAEDLPEQVIEAQRDVTSVDAEIVVVEQGRPDHAGERRFAGYLSYEAPERLALELTEDLEPGAVDPGAVNPGAAGAADDPVRPTDGADPVPGGTSGTGGRGGAADTGGTSGTGGTGGAAGTDGAGDTGGRGGMGGTGGDGMPGVLAGDPGGEADRTRGGAPAAGAVGGAPAQLVPGEGDVRLLVRKDRWWLQTVRSCTVISGQTSCPAGGARWIQEVVGREPFSDAAPIPLELIGAVDSFTLAAAPPVLGERRIAEREAIGVRVPAAQVAHFLAALSPGGDLRPVHPGDPVDVWLDRDDLVPLAVDVAAGESDERAAWATANGFREKPGDTVLSFSVVSLAVNEAVPNAVFEWPEVEVEGGVDDRADPPAGEDGAVGSAGADTLDDQGFPAGGAADGGAGGEGDGLGAGAGSPDPVGGAGLPTSTTTTSDAGEGPAVGPARPSGAVPGPATPLSAPTTTTNPPTAPTTPPEEPGDPPAPTTTTTVATTTTLPLVTTTTTGPVDDGSGEGGEGGGPVEVDGTVEPGDDEPGADAEPDGDGTPPGEGAGPTDRAPVDDSTTRDDGFRSGPADLVPEPSRLPDGMELHASGTIRTGDGPVIGLRSWTDGRAWAKVRATDGWDGPRLFGELGGVVRQVDLGEAGQGYVSADGRKVALHTDGLDVVVGGSLPPDQLRDLAASLDVVGEPVPDDWREAASATIEEAREIEPRLLAPRALEGFGPPAVDIGGGSVTLIYAGPGDRTFTLTRSDVPELVPADGGGSFGVQVRDVDGRYNVRRGELEWSEGRASYSLRSATVTLSELLAIADTLAATPDAP